MVKFNLKAEGRTKISSCSTGLQVYNMLITIVITRSITNDILYPNMKRAHFVQFLTHCSRKVVKHCLEPN